MFDQTEPETSFDHRTETLRMGERVQSTVTADLLLHCAEDALAILHESETGDSDIFETATRWEVLSELATDGPLAGLPQMEQVLESELKVAFNGLNDFTPRFAYYGFHRDEASSMGVFISWRHIDQAVEKGEMAIEEGPWRYVRVVNARDVVSIYDVGNRNIFDADKIDAADLALAYDYGEVLDVDGREWHYVLARVINGASILINALDGTLVFVAD